MSDIRANLTIDGGLTGSLSIGSVHQDMVDRIEEVEARMSAAEADIEARMSAAEDKLDAAEDSVEARMSAVEDDIDARMSAAEDDIDARMSAAEDDIDARMSAAEDSVQDAIQNSLPEIVESRTDYFGYDHPTLQDRLTSDFDKINAKIAAYGYIPYEGTSIYATNTMEGSVNNTTIKGRTLQNVIHKDTFKKSTAYHTVSAEHVVLDGGYIKMIANNAFINAWTHKTDLIKPNTVYTMILEIKENTLISDTTNPFVLAGNNQTECFEGVRYINAGDIGVEVFTLETRENLDGVQYLLRSYINKSVTEGHITFRYMILEGDHTQTPIEELPFVEGIESVGDESKNLINETTLVDGGASSNTGNLVADPERKRTDYIEVVPNVNYVTKNVDSILFYTENKEFIERQLVQGVTPENAKYMVCRVLKTSMEPQFNYGTILQKYQPYYDGYKISGKSIGKNLFDGNYHEMYIHTDYLQQSSDEYSAYIKCKPNTRYSISKTNKSTISLIVCGVNEYPYNKQSIENRRVYSGSYIAENYVTGANSNYLVVRFCKSTENDILEEVLNSLQIEEDTQATPYEPYQESTYEYILARPLRSLPNGVRDEIDLETGVLTRRVGRVVLDETSIIGAVTGVVDPNFARCNIVLETVKNNGALICDSFPYFNIHALPGGSITINFECICPNSVLNEINVILKRERVGEATISDFSNYFKNNPLTVYYELTNPTTEQLTPQRLKSFDGITHVISDNKIMPYISTTVPTDISLLIESMMQDNTMLANEVYDLRRSGEELLNEINELEEENLDNMEVSLDQEVRLTMLEMGV